MTECLKIVTIDYSPTTSIYIMIFELCNDILKMTNYIKIIKFLII